MAFIHTLLLLHLSLLLCTSITLSAANQSPLADSPHSSHHHHHHSATPSKPPSQPPSPRKLVAVRGVVYCKSCKYRGIDAILGLGATPLAGATVKLQCNNTKNPISEQTTTDKNGFFFLMPHDKVTTSGYHKCKVFLVSSPVAKCGVPTDFHGGATGAALVPTKLASHTDLPNFKLFTVGPFAFEPNKNVTCH